MKLPVKVNTSASDAGVLGCPIDIFDADEERIAVLYGNENPNALKDARLIVRLLNQRKRKPSRTRKT